MKDRVKKILFVCTGNICRSPLAHAVFEKTAREQNMNCEVESAGTHGYHVGENADPRMRRTAAHHGFSFSHAARHFRASDMEYYDYVFVMDRGHYREIQRLAGENTSARLRMFREFDPEGSSSDDVPDPYYGGAEGFENVFIIVKRTIDNMLGLFKSGSL